MRQEELITIGGLLLDYMALLTWKYKEAASRVERDYLESKIQTVKEFTEIIGKEIN